MALTAKDFVLTQAQLDAINDHFKQRVQAHADADADMNMPTASVSFHFTPVLGRSFTVSFDGEQPEKDIE